MDIDVERMEADTEVGSPTTCMHSAWYFDRCISILKVDSEKLSFSPESPPCANNNNNSSISDHDYTTSGEENQLLASTSSSSSSGGGGESQLSSVGSQSDTNDNKHVAMETSTPHSISGSSSLESSPGHTGLATSKKVPDDMQLLAKLEEANRLLEEDRKSTRSLSPQPPKSRCNGNGNGNGYHPHQLGHSRQGSMSSMISNTSACSTASGFEEADDLWTLWGKIVTDWETVIKKKPNHIRDLIRKGIPHHFRGIAWQLLCGAHDSQAKQQYAEYIKMESPCEKTIRRDITRTYPEHDFFKEKNGLGQESLFNVMKAFSLHDREVGYCQGSGFIVGLLLMQMPEEEAFAVLVKIMQEYRLRELFKPSMAELGLCMFQLECMIQEQLPALFAHFQTQSFCVSMFASSWFLTLFTTTLPLSTACRIFDIFLSEGLEMVFRVGFAVLQISQNELLTLDMEGMIKYLQKDLSSKIEPDPEVLFNTAYQVKYNGKKMKKLEKEYNALKSKEQEEQVELRRLRTENRLLRQRIDNLEKETSTLADRLIQDQVKYAQQEEEIFSLRRDLAGVRQHDQSLTKRLNSVTNEFEEFKRSNSGTSSVEDEEVQELQRQLSDIKEKEVESHGTMRELRDKIRELENANRQMQTEPTTEIQTLQEELIACKLREAEANLSMKELRQKVTDLDKYWQKHQDKMEKLQSEGAPSKKASKTQIQQLTEDMMTLRIREAHAVGELNEMKQKVMELETQNHICDRQIKRQGDENEKLEAKLEQADAREKELQSTIKELEHKYADIDSKRKEDLMMSRIKDAEYSQNVAEMRQRVAELEIENQELVTAGQLHEKGERQDLENKISDLQEEVLQLKMARRLQSLSSLAINHMAIDTESDYDTDDMEATVLASRLKLTDSMMCEDGVLPDSLPPMPNSHRLRPTELDSSDGEVFDSSRDESKRRITRKKRRTPSKKDGDSVDLDKTPTQDTINMELFAVEMENGEQQGSNNEGDNSEGNNTIVEVDCVASTAASDSFKANGTVSSSTESTVCK